MMELISRFQFLKSVFSYDRKVRLEDNNLEISPFVFTSCKDEVSDLQKELSPPEFCNVTDDRIDENKKFEYVIFHPAGRKKSDQAIILLHGLNERSWEKYLPWAEYLSSATGKPVILFPIAFHMNRSPKWWSNPRSVLPWVSARKKEVANLENSTFVNVALSSRLSKEPRRLYTSGKETIYNLHQLVQEIKDGRHPLFKEDTSVNFFAYSIGAFVSQILFLANPGKLFTDSRLFMFCGGSIFKEMNGRARDILDNQAFDLVSNYFIRDFFKGHIPGDFFGKDDIENSFKMMLRPDVMLQERESFFQKASDRIRAISLKHDTVIPTLGLKKAMGRISEKITEEWDFPFTYSHQMPFPVNDKDTMAVNLAFNQVFHKASGFL
ncbi:MAG: DUF6051 family protein [Candidatus Azobacteroides sp.]|nr:DUF6051 family protein [Candidatus Azobacteroides sp.]